MLDEFMERVDQDAPNGCWMWTGYHCNGGYGGIHTRTDSRYGRASRLAHRVSFELHVRDLLPDEHLHHVCDNKLCVNPSHLMVVTARQHMRLHKANEWLTAAKLAQTHCRHGHEFTPSNTGRTSQGRRYCRKCRNARTMEWRRRQRAAA